MPRDIIAVVQEITQLLLSCGEPERAAWLQELEAALCRPDESEVKLAAIKVELHGIILGMNGLLDLWLKPAEGCELTESDATRRLHHFADELYRLTRSRSGELRLVLETGGSCR